MDINDEEEECPVCMEPLTPASTKILSCDHRLCRHCWDKMIYVTLNNTCPMCRAHQILFREHEPYGHLIIINNREPTRRHYPIYLTRNIVYITFVGISMCVLLITVLVIVI